MDHYPTVLNERETLELVLEKKLSLSRFGDGEIRLAVGPPAKPCKTQPPGEKPSLVPSDLPEALHVDVITGPHRDAYARIDHIDGCIGNNQDRIVILCLGAAATCLAERCAQRGVQAVDLGSIGRWIRRWRKDRVS